MRETSEMIAGDIVFEGGNRSFSARPIAVSVDCCAASSHVGGRPFPDARRFLMQAKQTKPCRGSWNRKPDARGCDNYHISRFDFSGNDTD
jgi:hypothetical protein